MTSDQSDGNGGVYLAMMLAGTIELIAGAVIYLAYSWWMGL